MSTRSTIWLWPDKAHSRAIHVYREMIDDWIHVDISRGYGFHFRIAPTRRLVRRWLKNLTSIR